MTRNAAILALCAILGGCTPAAPPRQEAVLPPEPAIPSSGRIVLRGNTLNAPVLRRSEVCTIPFGREANAILMERQKGGVQFAVSPENCSENGCIIETGDTGRIVVARNGMADAFVLDLIEHGWHRHGISSISEGGWLAIPVTNAEGGREIWVLDSRFRMRHRITHKVVLPLMLRWRTDDLFLVYGTEGVTDIRRVDLDNDRLVSSTPCEPWWLECPGISASPYAAGFGGENPLGFEGKLTIPLWRKTEALPVLLELGPIVHPSTPDGVATPVKVVVACDGRISVITSLGENIWCMRFKPDGQIEAVNQVLGSIAGDAKSIQIDRRGRFYYIETTLEKSEPTKMTLVVLE